jgi:uncharacterized protein (DUF4213/DUF364 family)
MTTGIDQHDIDQHALVRAVLSDLAGLPDHPVRRIASGACLVAVESRRVGLASQPAPPFPDGPSGPEASQPGGPASAMELASRLSDARTWGRAGASLAMAAVNSLLPLPGEGVPEPDLLEMKAQDLVASVCRGRRIAVIGNFPFVERLEGLRQLWVLERRPVPGTLPAALAGEILPQADAVLVTATTLLNGTLAAILALCRPDAARLLVGPSAPFSPSLLGLGVDAIAGCAVDRPDEALAGVEAGLPFRALSSVRHLIRLRPGFPRASFAS